MGNLGGHWVVFIVDICKTKTQNHNFCSSSFVFVIEMSIDIENGKKIWIFNLVPGLRLVAAASLPRHPVFRTLAVRPENLHQSHHALFSSIALGMFREARKAHFIRSKNHF